MFGVHSLAFLVPSAAHAAAPCPENESCPTIATLPIELGGPAGAEASIRFELTAAEALRPTLSLRIHDLDTDAEGAIRLNGGAWWSLQDEVSPGDPGAGDVVDVTVRDALSAALGGIGGPIATLDLEVALPPGALVAGENTLTFRLDETDGVGFRVLDLDLLDAAGAPLFPPELFAVDDPDLWAPPDPSPEGIAAGEALWRTASLTIPGGTAIPGHCADCHAQDGRDLAYFGYSNAAIAARAEFHGLSHTEAEQIASFIRSLDVPHPGRPWNPPFQPGPGTDDKPAEEWAAGAGLDWVLADDEETLDYLFPDGFDRDVFLHGDTDLRNIPIGFQMIDWNRWLPEMEPREAMALFGPAGVADAEALIAAWQDARATFEGKTHAERCEAGEAAFAELAGAVSHLFGTYPVFTALVGPNGEALPADAARAGRARHAIGRWYAMKMFELHQEYGLESCAAELYADGDDRAWFQTLKWSDISTTGLSAEDARGHDPRNPTAAWTHDDMQWWTVQKILNSGGTRAACDEMFMPTIYQRSAFNHLEDASGLTSYGLRTALALRDFQDVAQRVDPHVHQCDDGWEPVSRGSIWQFLSDFSRTKAGMAHHSYTDLVEEAIGAWLEANQRFAPVEYFTAVGTSRVVADPTFDNCTPGSRGACWHDPGYVDHMNKVIPERVSVVAGEPGGSDMLAEQLRIALDDSRALFVDPALRQELADWAYTVYPLIDWDQWVDDFHPARENGGSLSTAFAPIPVTIDLGDYAGTWNVDGETATHVGIAVVDLVPGRRRIVVDGWPIDLLVYPDGQVVPFVAGTAVGGLRSFTVLSSTVTIDPADYRGAWQAVTSTRVLGASGARQVLRGQQYPVNVYTPGPESTFHVNLDGTLVSDDPESYEAVGSTLRFRTVSVPIVVHRYVDAYNFVPYQPLRFGNGTSVLLRGERFENSVDGLQIAVDGSGAVSVNSETAYVEAGTVHFDPWPVKLSGPAGVGWTLESGGPGHVGTDTVWLVEGWYGLWGVSGTSFRVGDVCELDRTVIGIGSQTWTLECDLPTWYVDADADGYGDETTAVERLHAEAGEVAFAGDCDDTDPSVVDCGDRICDANHPDAPALLDRFGVSPGMQQIAVDGTLAFVAQYNDGLGIYDLAANPPVKLSGTRRTSRPATGVVAAHGHAYVGSKAGGIAVYDVSNPAAPVFRTELEPTIKPQQLELGEDGLLYAGTDTQGFLVIDIATNPAAPTVKNRILPGGSAIDVSVENGVAVLAARGNGVTIENVTNPLAPTLIRKITGFYAHHVDVAGRWAVTVSGGYGGGNQLRIVDLTSPASAVAVPVAMPGVPWDVEVVGDHAIVAIDLANANPELVWVNLQTAAVELQLDTPNTWAGALAVDEEGVLLAGGGDAAGTFIAEVDLGCFAEE